MKQFVIVVVVMVAAIVCGTFQLHTIRDVSNDAELVWNDREAWLFIGSSRLGWSHTLPEVLLDWLSAMAGAGTPAEHRYAWTTAIGYTDAGITSYSLDNVLVVPPLIVLDGRLYGGIKWRWSGSTFERTSEAESDRLSRLQREPGFDLHRPGGESTYVGAVLRRAERVSRFPMNISGKAVEFVVRRGSWSESINLELRGAPPRQVWSLNSRPKLLTRSKYDDTFRGVPSQPQFR